MDLLSGGVDEDLYNDLYENETALDSDDSFFETPVLIAANSIAGDWTDVINAIVEQYNTVYAANNENINPITATSDYFLSSWVYGRNTSFQLSFEGNRKADDLLVTRIVTILNTLEYGGYKYSNCASYKDSGTTSAYITCDMTSK